MKKLVSSLPNFKGKSSILRGLTKVEDRYVSNTRGFDKDEDIKKLLKDYNENVNLHDLVKPYYNKIGKKVSDISKMQYVDLKM